jgi:UDP-glucose 4-epimerase
MAKILVTGGTGFIGSHTTVELIEQGHEVIAVDNLSNSNLEVLDGVEAIVGKKPAFYNVDLADQQATRAFFKEVDGIDAIIHFAALKAVGESVEKPALYYKNNMVSLLNIMDAMETHGVKNMIFSSSCTVYGLADELPVTENTPVKPANSPYGNTKQIAEEILSETCATNENYQVISLRYFNPIGAHDSVKIGELPLGVPKNLMPYVTQTGAGLRDELKVFGSDYDTHDGTGVRDYIHVVDLAKAHIKALDRLLDNKFESNYEVYNVGTGTGYSVLDVIKSFEKTSGKKLNYVLVDRRPGDVPSMYADPSKAKNVLGWEATYDIDDMTRSAWNWEKKLRGIS